MGKFRCEVLGLGGDCNYAMRAMLRAPVARGGLPSVSSRCKTLAPTFRGVHWRHVRARAAANPPMSDGSSEAEPEKPKEEEYTIADSRAFAKEFTEEDWAEFKASPDYMTVWEKCTRKWDCHDEFNPWKPCPPWEEANLFDKGWILFRDKTFDYRWFFGEEPLLSFWPNILGTLYLCAVVFYPQGFPGPIPDNMDWSDAYVSGQNAALEFDPFSFTFISVGILVYWCVYYYGFARPAERQIEIKKWKQEKMTREYAYAIARLTQLKENYDEAGKDNEEFTNGVKGRFEDSTVKKMILNFTKCYDWKPPGEDMSKAEVESLPERKQRIQNEFQDSLRKIGPAGLKQYQQRVAELIEMKNAIRAERAEESVSSGMSSLDNPIIKDARQLNNASVVIVDEGNLKAVSRPKKDEVSVAA